MNTATLFFMKYGDKSRKAELSLDEKNISDEMNPHVRGSSYWGLK